MAQEINDADAIKAMVPKFRISAERALKVTFAHAAVQRSCTKPFRLTTDN